jgi:hypothetical protein
LQRNTKTTRRTAEKPPFFFLPCNRYFFIDKPRTIASHHPQQKRLNRLSQSIFCIFPYFAQNATALKNVSKGLPRSISGRFTAYFGHIPKSAVFLAFFRLFVVFFRRVLL